MNFNFIKCYEIENVLFLLKENKYGSCLTIIRPIVLFFKLILKLYFSFFIVLSFFLKVLSLLENKNRFKIDLRFIPEKEKKLKITFIPLRIAVTFNMINDELYFKRLDSVLRI